MVAAAMGRIPAFQLSSVSLVRRSISSLVYDSVQRRLHIAHAVLLYDSTQCSPRKERSEIRRDAYLRPG